MTIQLIMLRTSIVFFAVSGIIFAILGDQDRWFQRLAIAAILFGLDATRHRQVKP